MHEMSLVQGLLGQLHGLAAEHNAKKVTVVRMEIGPFAGVVCDSFQFGFDILSKEDPLTETAELIIESPLVTYRCCDCGQQIEQEQRPEQCPHCSETLFLPEGSSDVILLQVEME